MNFIITSLVILPVSNVTWKVFYSFPSCRFNEIKYNIIFTLLTCNILLHIYSPMTLSYKTYAYYSFSSGASTRSSLTQPSSLHSLTLCYIFYSIYWSLALPHTIQQQQCLLHTHLNRHADVELSGHDTAHKYQSTLQNSLCHLEVDYHVQNYADSSFLSRPTLLSLFLAISLSPGSTCRFRVCTKTPRDHSQPRLWLSLVLHPTSDLEALCWYSQSFWQRHKRSWPTSIPQGKYYIVFTLSVVF